MVILCRQLMDLEPPYGRSAHSHRDLCSSRSLLGSTVAGTGPVRYAILVTVAVLNPDVGVLVESARCHKDLVCLGRNSRDS